MGHWVIIVWLNLTNESFTCPAHKLPSEAWLVKLNSAQLSGKDDETKRRRRWGDDSIHPTKRWTNTELKPKLSLKNLIISMTECLQSNPSLKKGKGEALTSPRNPLTKLTAIKLSRKYKYKVKPNVCVSRMLCKVHPEFYYINLPWPNT